MTNDIYREEDMVAADEVFLAWTSGDLDRMLRARPLQAHDVDRHFLLMGIVGLTYYRRDDERARALCLEVGRQHLIEFPKLKAALMDSMGGILPRVTTYARLATVLSEDGLHDEAIAVCHQAIILGLHDGTKGDFPGRVLRLRKAAVRSAGSAERGR